MIHLWKTHPETRMKGIIPILWTLLWLPLVFLGAALFFIGVLLMSGPTEARWRWKDLF
jgi:hypothetical protein